MGILGFEKFWGDLWGNIWGYICDPKNLGALFLYSYFFISVVVALVVAFLVEARERKNRNEPSSYNTFPQAKSVFHPGETDKPNKAKKSVKRVYSRMILSEDVPVYIDGKLLPKNVDRSWISLNGYWVSVDHDKVYLTRKGIKDKNRKTGGENHED